MMIKNKKIVVLLVIVLLALIVFLYFYSRKIEQVKLEVVSTEFYPPYVTLGSKPSSITAILKLPESYQKPRNNQILIQRVTNKVLPVGVLRDDGKNEDKVANDNIYSGTILVRQTVADDVHLRAVALLTPKKKAVSDEFSIISGAAVEAGSGGTVKNSEGIAISMEPGSVDYPAFLSVKSLPAEAISAPVGKLPLKKVVKVDFRPLDPSLDVGGS
uniref:choice-of-anchor X domain-containing protein n=1 Tax=Sedimenticola sp. TaxID=1940285 RepID=UPI003D0E9F27